MTAHLISSYGLERKTKKTLQEHYRDLSGKLPDFRWKKDDLIPTIRKLLEAKREERFREATSIRQPKSLCEIPASEVNAWLESLPVEVD